MSSLTLLEKTDPKRADEIRAYAGEALEETKKIASAWGVSTRRVRQMRGGERTAAVSRFFIYLASLPLQGLSPYPLATKVQGVAYQSMILSMDDNALVKRFWELMAREAEREGIENQCSAMFARNGDVAELADCTEREAAISIELAAVARELSKRGIDPRK
jgi:hypothetical protein